MFSSSTQSCPMRGTCRVMASSWRPSATPSLRLSQHGALRNSSVVFQHMQRIGHSSRQRRCIAVHADLKALLFDCDGVILESEELHRLAYNAAFEEFNVRPKGGDSVANWSVEFYDKLQNSIGGGKPKMRWYFGEYGWPSSTISSEIPADDAAKTSLIDQLQDWKTQHYQDMIASGKVKPRPGVLNLFDEARSSGLLVGVCSAATKSSAIVVLNSLLGPDRFQGLDVFLAGDDVQNKKPDPSIYKVAASRLNVDPADCLVIEDSTIGLQAARGAGMRCVITYTDSTKDQEFQGAEKVLESLGGEGTTVGLTDLLA